MIKLVASDDRFFIYQAKDVLDEKGIPCFIKNEFLSGAIGELTPQDCQPELWLHDHEWLNRAQREIENLQSQHQYQQDWQCLHCDELNEATFQICWHCEQPRDKAD